MTKVKLTVLIGSFARGDAGPDSDVDILRVGHCSSVERPAQVGKNIPISYIDYDFFTFMELHQQGSLFLHHVFQEGRLIDGNNNLWVKLKNNFNVTYDHKNSINEYCELLQFIDEYPGFEHSFMPYLSNVFKALKNIGIFKLAEKGCFVFDKTTALVRGCGLTSNEAETLITCNNCFERSRVPSIKELETFKIVAKIWKKYNHEFIKVMSNDQ
ncbi:nucleotidyltransferase domain-containing protein [Desulfobacter curvatus]|uniref:nucleotidyltransferase domain-containing protein n=1 Tax=Desulfobacter curvatus TaxID=2290 RepID=UPI00037C3D4F|nr:nucleotidyltransferase domain-containing protein [Desulfobacter curvatus]